MSDYQRSSGSPEQAAAGGGAGRAAGGHRRSCSGSLYRSLGVKSDATDAEIRSAFHREALKYHPDKCGSSAESVDRMKQINHAYQTLKDPQRRRTYDLLGTKHMETMQHSMPPVLFETLVNNQGAITFVVIFLTMFSLITLVALVMISEKADGGLLNTPWARVFVPVWILDVLIIIATFFGIHHCRELELAQILATVLSVIQSWLFVATTVTLCLALDGGGRGVVSWSAAFVPLWFFLAVRFADTLQSLSYQVFATSVRATGSAEDVAKVNQDENGEGAKSLYAFYIFRQLAAYFTTLIFALLLWLKLSATLPTMSVWVVAAPLLVFFLGPMVYSVYATIASSRLPAVRQKIAGVIFLLFGYSTTLCTLVLGTIKAQQADAGVPVALTVPMRYVLIPQFVYVSLISAGLVFLSLLLAIMPWTDLVDSIANAQRQGPGGGGGADDEMRPFATGDAAPRQPARYSTV